MLGYIFDKVRTPSMQNNLENSTDNTDWKTNNEKTPNAAGSTLGKKFAFGRSMTFGGFGGGRDDEEEDARGRSGSELSVEEFNRLHANDGDQPTIDRKAMKKENTRTFTGRPMPKSGLGIDAVSMSSKLDQLATGQLKPGSTRNRNTMQQKRIKNLNNLMSPRADIDDALSCSSQSEATTKGYGDAATLMLTDIDIFGNELTQFANHLQESVMEKRCASGRMKDEP